MTEQGSSAETTAPQEKAPDPGKTSWWKWLVAVVVLFATAYGGWRLYWKMQIRSRLAAIRAQGYPATLAELDAWYKKPTGPNAADIYMKAFALEPKDSDPGLPCVGTGLLPPLGEPMDAAMKEKVVKYLRDADDEIRMLREAATIKECRYPGDMKNFSAEHLTQLRQAARILLMDVTYRAGEGRQHDASESMIAGFALARSLRDEPALSSHIFGITCNATMLNGLSRQLTAGQPQDEDLVRISAALAGARLEETSTRVIAGTRCSLDEMLSQGDMPPTLPMERRSERLAVFALKKAGLFDAGRVFAFDAFSKDISVAALPFPDRFREAKKHREELKDKFDRHNWLHHVANLTLVPLGDWDALAAAQMSCAQTALAVERYRLKNGRLPDDLGLLEPDFLNPELIDPYNGKALRYKKLDKGYVIYSVGADGVDGGADESPNTANDFGGTKDVVFKVLR